MDGNYYGARLLSNVLNARPSLPVYPVNPRYAGAEVQGLPCHARLSDLPAVPDLVLITSPVRTVVPTLEEAAALGVATAVVISSELGETSTRRALDGAIARIAQTSGMRIIGPNSMGVMNGHARLNGSFSSGTHRGGFRPGPVAVLAQSGAVISYLLQTYAESDLGYSWMVSTGNEAGTTLEQLLEGVVADPATGIVLLFLEGVTDGPALRRAALRAATQGKPVLMMKAGISEAGMRAVESHTGRIAGGREVYAALAEEAGIHQARSYDDLFDAARTLAVHGLRRKDRPHGRRAAVITTSGGAGTVAADHLSAAGWSLPEPPAEIAEALSHEAKQGDIGNPVDVTGAFARHSLLPRLLAVLDGWDGIDAVFVVTGAGGDNAEPVAKGVAEAAQGMRQDVLVAWMGRPEPVRQVLETAGIPTFTDPLRAIAAAEACARYREAQSLRDARAGLLAMLETTAEAPPAATRPTGAAELFTELAAAGVACAPFGVTAGLDPAEAADIATRIGFPVALKLDSPALSHKTEAGGVKLRLDDRAAVEAAAQQLAAVGAGLPTARLLVQRMASGIEVLVGIKRDPSFGPLLVLGRGGVEAELHADVVATLLPTDAAGLERMLARHARLEALLAGWRGAQPADRTALLALLRRIAAWAVAQGPVLEEADFNPVMVGPEGAVVVDARAGWA
jgi:acetyltransferase